MDYFNLIKSDILDDDFKSIQGIIESVNLTEPGSVVIVKGSYENKPRKALTFSSPEAYQLFNTVLDSVGLKQSIERKYISEPYSINGTIPFFRHSQFYISHTLKYQVKEVPPEFVVHKDAWDKNGIEGVYPDRIFIAGPHVQVRQIYRRYLNHIQGNSTKKYTKRRGIDRWNIDYLFESKFRMSAAIYILTKDQMVLEITQNQARWLNPNNCGPMVNSLGFKLYGYIDGEGFPTMYNHLWRLRNDRGSRLVEDLKLIPLLAKNELKHKV